MALSNDDHLAALGRDLIQALDDLSGLHAGFRPAHAKGIMLSGTFHPAAGAGSLTRAPHVQQQSTPVTVRFSDSGGVPTAADNDPSLGPRGIAIRFHLAEHVHTDIIGHSTDGFPVRTAEEFLEFLRARLASGPGAPNPTPVESFLATHPAALKFVQTPKPIPTRLRERIFLHRHRVQVHEQGRPQPIWALPHPSGGRPRVPGCAGCCSEVRQFPVR